MVVGLVDEMLRFGGENLGGASTIRTPVTQVSIPGLGGGEEGRRGGETWRRGG